MSFNKGTAEEYAIGAGSYYLGVFCLAFYPAIVMLIPFFEKEEWVNGFIAFGVTYAILFILMGIFVETRNLVVLLLLIGIYLFFLGPAVQYILYINEGERDPIHHETIPFPGFTWSPFVFVTTKPPIEKKPYKYEPDENNEFRKEFEREEAEKIKRRESW